MSESVTDRSDRTVGAVLRRWATESPDRTFLVCDDERLTYSELLEQSALVAKGLVAAGAGHGSHVGLLLPNGTDFAVAALAIMRIGAVAVPLSTLSSVAELHTLIDRSDTEILLSATFFRNRRFDELVAEAIGLAGPCVPPVLSPKAPALRRLFFYGPGPLALGTAPGWTSSDLLTGATQVSDELLAAVEDHVRPSDPVVIVHTSGSTSAPKGVVHAHGALIDHLRVLNELRTLRPDDVLFSNSPFFWIGGFAYTFLGTLLAGATTLCSREADPAKVLGLLERERPTMCNGYAASATALAADPSFASRNLSSMRRGNLYSIMPADARAADPQLRTNMLGMTEGGSVVLTGTDEADLPEHLRGSFGRPTPDLEARVVDCTTGEDCAVGERGELWLRGPAMMLGYYGLERSAAFDADGWFHTGDLVHTDEHGHWYFHGRGDDMIKTAGANVSPAEVEEAILSATGLGSIVFGLPDNDKGQVVAVALLLDGDDSRTPDLEQLRVQLARLLSSYKIPRIVHALRATDVPLRSSGKVDMTQLKDLLGAG